MPVDLSNLVMNIGRRTSEDGGSDIVDIITFVESAWGLGMKLYPVQRVILKAHYGLELDDNPEGFDLESPIPLDHPKYDEMIDYKPHSATNKIEVVDLDRISDHEAIGLRAPDGTDYVLQRGDHWEVVGTPVDTLESIADAINLHAAPDFKAEVYYGTNEMEITSGAFSSAGNEARLELSTAKGIRISYPPTQEAQAGYAPDAHNFYGGGGGYYKNRIVVTDFRRENARVMTEAGYLKYLHEEGRCNISEVIPGKQRREMVLSVGRRSGKCVTGDMLVLTDRGVLPIVELGDPDGPEIQPLDVGVAQEGVGARARSSHFYNGGVKPTFKVTTRCGYQVEGTANHRIRVMSLDGRIVWRFLDEIQEGDQVCIHRGTDFWTKTPVNLVPFHNQEGRKDLEFPAVLTPDWGYLLGVLVGDGCWTLSNRVEITVGDPEYRDAVFSLVERLLGDAKYRPDLRREATGQVQSNSTAWRKFLHDLGWTLDCEAREKRIPWVIMQSPKEIVTEFLSGLFDADGGVESAGKVVSFSTASERLARDVQVLLLNLGVVSRIRTKWNKQYSRDYYILTVRGLRSRRAFAEQVGFRLKRKMDPLQGSLEGVVREGGGSDSIPHLREWATRLLHSVPRSKPGQGWGRSHLRQALGNTIKPSSKDEMTRPRLAASIKVARGLGAEDGILEHLQDLVEKDYFYDPVDTVLESEAPVFDLSVPDGHMFVANGMTNHNTLITSCIVAYETYKLLVKGNPQKYYGASQSGVIQLISVATDKDQAGLLYREASGHFSKCEFFKPYAANATQSFATFQTPYDIDHYGSYSDNPKARYSINVTFRSCVAKGLRGGANILVALDEVAHFGDKGQASADEVYQAVEPSTRTFSKKDPETGRPLGENEGRIIMISSPLGKQGLFYKQFMLGFGNNKAADNLLCIQAPTWEVNPTVPAETFVGSYLKDPRVFDTEFGAVFTDRTRGWIEDHKDLFACIDPKLRPKKRAPSRMPHFMGLDYALVGDYCAAVIGHTDTDGQVVVDLVERIRAGEGNYAHLDRLSVDDIADWIEELCSRFYIAKGLSDQAFGIVVQQELQKRGLSQIEYIKHPKTLTSQMFANFKDLMYDEKVTLYDWPRPKDDPEAHSPFIQELLELQATMHSKHVITVEAPNLEGKHDDMADALVRMTWLALNHKSKYVGFATGNQAVGPMRGGRAVARARARARRGGSHSSRQVPRRGRGGRGRW